jgi:hypothetical protein
MLAEIPKFQVLNKMLDGVLVWEVVGSCRRIGGRRTNIEEARCQETITKDSGGVVTKLL